MSDDFRSRAVPSGVYKIAKAMVDAAMSSVPIGEIEAVESHTGDTKFRHAGQFECRASDLAADPGCVRLWLRIARRLSLLRALRPSGWIRGRRPEVRHRAFRGR